MPEHSPERPELELLLLRLLLRGFGRLLRTVLAVDELETNEEEEREQNDQHHSVAGGFLVGAVIFGQVVLPSQQRRLRRRLQSVTATIKLG